MGRLRLASDCLTEACLTDAWLTDAWLTKFCPLSARKRQVRAGGLA